MKAIHLSGEQVTVPADVVDLSTFRRWTLSKSFPSPGRIDYLTGNIWIDMLSEDLYVENQPKLAMMVGLCSLLEENDSGQYISRGMRIVCPHADLSLEPDGAFLTYSAKASGQIRAVSDNFELEGTPDMVLEIVNEETAYRDCGLLPAMYWKAGIREYWLVDARCDPPTFTILLHTPYAYDRQRTIDGWSRSNVFGREFSFLRGTDKLGDPDFELLVR